MKLIANVATIMVLCARISKNLLWASPSYMKMMMQKKRTLKAFRQELIDHNVPDAVADQLVKQYKEAFSLSMMDDSRYRKE